MMFKVLSVIMILSSIMMTVIIMITTLTMIMMNIFEKSIFDVLVYHFWELYM